MLNIVAPLIGGLFDLLKGNTKDIAQTTGVEEGIVGKVLGAVEAYATKDERLQTMVAEQLDKARQYDISTFDTNDLFSNRLRSCVRPLVTFSAMAWYIYARLSGVVLAVEDYTLVGGIIAFWFGFRPFEKSKSS